MFTFTDMRKLLVLLWLPCACSLLGQVAGAAFRRPSLSFQDAHLDHVDFDGADLTLTWLVTNPNALGLDLAQADYALQIEDHAVASGRPQSGLQIPGGATTRVAFPAHLVWKELAPAVQALFAQDIVRYRATGSVGVQSPVGLLTLPFAHEGTFAPPHVPDLSLHQPKIVSIGLTGARLALPLAIGNRNAFPLPIAGILGTVQIGGETVGRLALPAQGVVEANQRKVIDVPLDVSFLGAGSAVAAALRSGVAQVQVDGTLTSGASTLPIHFAQTVQLKPPATQQAGPQPGGQSP